MLIVVINLALLRLFFYLLFGIFFVHFASSSAFSVVFIIKNSLFNKYESLFNIQTNTYLKYLFILKQTV